MFYCMYKHTLKTVFQIIYFLLAESNAESNHFESRLPPQLQQLVQKALDDIKQETRH